MNDALLILVILSLTFLLYRYIEYMRATRGTDGFAKRKIVQYLFLGFIALVGITTVFAEAIFEILGLQKPASFEWLSLVAYAIFAAAAVWSTKDAQIKSAEEKQPRPETTKVSQTHFGEGNNVAGDKKVYHINNAGATINQQNIESTIHNHGQGKVNDGEGSPEKILLEKIAYLRSQAAIMTGGAEKFKLKKQIEQTEQELIALKTKR